MPDVFYRFYHRSEKNACPDLNGLCPRPSMYHLMFLWRHLVTVPTVSVPRLREAGGLLHRSHRYPHSLRHEETDGAGCEDGETRGRRGDIDSQTRPVRPPLHRVHGPSHGLAARPVDSVEFCSSRQILSRSRIC